MKTPEEAQADTMARVLRQVRRLLLKHFPDEPRLRCGVLVMAQTQEEALYCQRGDDQDEEDGKLERQILRDEAGEDEPWRKSLRPEEKL